VASSDRSTAHRPPRSGRVLRTCLVVVTLGLGVGLAANGVGTWVEQRGELDEVRERRAALEEEIAHIELEIESITGPSGLRIAARCYGAYVEVGEELYANPGLEGCVTRSQP
jgi:hypothetical protein